MRESFVKVANKSRNSVTNRKGVIPLDDEESSNTGSKGIASDLEWDDVDTGGDGGCSFNCDSGQIMVFCLIVQGVLHPMLAYSFYFVVPYYVMEQTDWGVEALGLLFSASAIGEVVGAQVVPIAAVFDSNTALFLGHILQVILCFLGYFLVGGFIVEDLMVSTAGMGMIGFGYALSSVQAYSTALADGDEELEVSIMAAIGQSYTLSMVTMTLVFPPIYENFGFPMYALVMMLLAGTCLAALIIMVILLSRKLKEIEQINEANPQLNAVAAIDEEKEIDSPASAKSPVSCSKGPEKLDAVKLPLMKILSPSMYMLLVLKAVQAFANQMYFMSAPVVFSTDFNISSVISGYVVCGSTLFAMVVLFLSRRIVYVWSEWQYPWDIAIYFILFGVGSALFPIFWSPWVGYVGHAICVLTQQCLISVEMTTRLFLCPAQAFQKITGLSGFVQAASFLIAAGITPPIIGISLKLPFTILSLLFFGCAVATIFVFVIRKRFLASHFQSKKGYLASERAFYTAANKSAARRGALLNQETVTLVDDIDEKLLELQQRLFSRQSMAFLMNPMASQSMEAFVNNSAIECEMEKEMVLADQKMNDKIDEANKLFVSSSSAQGDGDRRESQIGELRNSRQSRISLSPISLRSRHSRVSTTLGRQSNARTSRISVLGGGQRMSRRSQFAQTMGRESVTMQRQSTVRASIAAISQKHNKGKKTSSIARGSILRRCEPSMGLGEQLADIEEEAKRRAEKVNSSKTAMFFGF